MNQRANDDRVTPRSYVTGDYLEYQKKYSQNPRESDKTLLRLMERIDSRLTSQSGWAGKVLDIGCSNGNFLKYLGHMHTALRCTGGELFKEIVDSNLRDPDLKNVAFREMDVLRMEEKDTFDIVIANAVLFRFNDTQLNLAVRNLAAALKPGGFFFCFEWVHRFDQLLTITEVTKGQPQGLLLHMRSYQNYRSILGDNGLQNVRFEPFEIPIDLEVSDNVEHLGTFTVRTDEGKRLNFRGALYQPWCHVVAQKT